MAATHTTVLALLVATLAGVAYAQNQYATTPVPILKQLNRHNDDGSYSYGYEGADGSFKIETKHATGEVFGKYGYVDDTGKLREVEYGASKRGFEVAGDGINVPPPVVSSNNNYNRGNEDDYDDGQYREDPATYYKNGNSVNQAPSRHRFSNPPAHIQQQQQQYNQPQQRYNPPQQYNQPQQQFNQPQQQYNQPQQRFNSQPQQYRQSAPAAVNQDLFRGHPATNFNVNTGSYSVSYSG